MVVLAMVAVVSGSDADGDDGGGGDDG